MRLFFPIFFHFYNSCLMHIDRILGTDRWPKICTVDGKTLGARSSLMFKLALKNIPCTIYLNLLLYLVVGLEKCIIGILTGQFRDCLFLKCRKQLKVWLQIINSKEVCMFVSYNVLFLFF